MRPFIGLFLLICANAAMAETVTLDCRVQYQKDGELSHRSAELQYEKRKLTVVKIDEQPVYRFSVNGTTVSTSMDNERIQIEFLPNKITWRSNFRDINFGSGICIKAKS
jgi:hypothetical protein